MKVSIVIPVYNTAKYIDGCLESCLAQDFDDYEVVLIDDGSSDGSSEKCDEWAKKDSRVKAFHFENGGAATARNRGIDNSTGEYICFVDSDDKVEKNYLSYLYSLIEETGADISVCGHIDVYGEKIKKEESFSDKKREIFTGREAMESLLYQRLFISAPWGMMSARKIWNEVRFPDGRRVEDVATIYREFSAAEKVVYGYENLYRHYMWADSTIYTTYSEKNREYLRHCHDMVKYVCEKYPACRNSGYHRLFSACFQILSETGKEKENAGFLKALYGDIKKVRKTVLFDKKARIRNRAAALLSYISIDILHGMLRLFYKAKLRRIKGKQHNDRGRLKCVIYAKI